MPRSSIIFRLLEYRPWFCGSPRMMIRRYLQEAPIELVAVKTATSARVVAMSATETFIPDT